MEIKNVKSGTEYPSLECATTKTLYRFSLSLDPQTLQYDETLPLEQLPSTSRTVSKDERLYISAVDEADFEMTLQLHFPHSWRAGQTQIPLQNRSDKELPITLFYIKCKKEEFTIKPFFVMRFNNSYSTIVNAKVYYFQCCTEATAINCSSAVPYSSRACQTN